MYNNIILKTTLNLLFECDYSYSKLLNHNNIISELIIKLRNYLYSLHSVNNLNYTKINPLYIKNQSDLFKNKDISHIFLKNNQLINNDDFLYSFNIKNNFHHFQTPNIQYEQIISMFLFKFLINEYL